MCKHEKWANQILGSFPKHEHRWIERNYHGKSHAPSIYHVCECGETLENYQRHDYETKLAAATARCAAMRLQFVKYVRENCKHIRHAVVDGIGYPDDVDGKCGGYCQNFDEPHEACQTCVAYAYPDEEGEPDAGTALLTRLSRMDEVLREVRGIADNFHDYGDALDIVLLIDQALKEVPPCSE